ncbi:hypothetical protein C7S20_02650 [Christiangramia fulva]|uniref:VacJ n=1 Tax=Christiangramia fulva TaxID=2126553 RepID=A0A2R3Z1X7_9FLAO|nr:hypothetical protein [Christiangramia fulva]AVR44248.1 hypothetical protein C7S20_02650 [Christiangramia fulva]
MEPIPYYYESINRNAILVKPRKPFFKWLNEVFKDEAPVTSMEENNLYLVREMASNEDVEKWVSKNFESIFTNELNDWCTNEDEWPAQRTYKLFKEWFNIEIHSMILDLEEEPVLKE